VVVALPHAELFCVGTTRKSRRCSGHRRRLDEDCVDSREVDVGFCMYKKTGGGNCQQ
jgi:hypothetical protein